MNGYLYECSSIIHVIQWLSHDNHMENITYYMF